MRDHLFSLKVLATGVVTLLATFACGTELVQGSGRLATFHAVVCEGSVCAKLERVLCMLRLGTGKELVLQRRALLIA